MHQDLALEPSMSILDNFVLNPATTRVRRIRWASEAERVGTILRDYGVGVNVRRQLADISPGQRAVVAFARAFDRIEHGVGILILDEPTASLEDHNAQDLFAAMRTARDRGCGILFVSHNLAEVREVCDTVSVLRDGSLVAAGNMADFAEVDLIRAIVGKDIGELYPPPPVPSDRPAALAVSALQGRTVKNLSFDLHEGEILGVTGLAGMGHDEVPGLIYGSTRLASGEIRIGQDEYRPSPKAALAHGIVYLPADRRGLGGDMSATVADNLTLPITARYFRRGRIDQQTARREVRGALRRFDVRPADPEIQLGHLSGGNQQKALLAKWLDLYGAARVMLLHEPTQGVDVGSRQDIFRFIRESVRAGQSALYVSSEYEDLAHLCDRVLVLRDGAVVAELAAPHLDATALAAASLASKASGG
jgi:ribose transport system ATP-binding protein